MIEPRKIETVREGATYKASTYHMTENGLEVFADRLISFVKGAKDNPDIVRQPGWMTETLLTVCKQYLEDVNKGSLRDDDTQRTIDYLELALDSLQRRAEKRKAAGTFGTYKP